MLTMPIALTEEQRALKAGVADICKRYPGEYWRDLDARRDYPEAFVTELTRAGYLAALIPQEYGGAGLGLFEGGLILETINANGGNAAACHAQMYIMGTLLRHGSEAQKRRYLPKIASGELRLQAFAVTEPNSGSDTTKLQTTAVRQGDLDWWRFVNTSFDVAMFGHQNDIYDKAFFDFFGLQAPTREPGFPRI